MSQDLRLHGGKTGSAVAVHVIPEGRVDEIVDILGDGTIQVRLACPGDVDSINSALIGYLSQILSIPPAKIDIVAGRDSRNKLVSIIDLRPEETHNRVIRALD
jgi:uncharacterized protein YggU (UPF0235/DUF167 family)